MEEAPKTGSTDVSGFGLETKVDAQNSWKDSPSEEARAAHFEPTDPLSTSGKVASTKDLRTSALETLNESLGKGLGAAFAEAFGDSETSNSGLIPNSFASLFQSNSTVPSSRTEVGKESSNSEVKSLPSDSDLSSPFSPNESFDPLRGNRTQRSTTQFGTGSLFSRFRFGLLELRSSGEDYFDDARNILDNLLDRLPAIRSGFGEWLSGFWGIVKHQVKKFFNFCLKVIERLTKKKEDEQSEGKSKGGTWTSRKHAPEMNRKLTLEDEQTRTRDSDIELPLELISRRGEKESWFEKVRDILFGLGAKAEEKKREKKEAETREEIEEVRARRAQVSHVAALNPSLETSEILQYYESGGDFVENKSTDELLALAASDAQPIMKEARVRDREEEGDFPV